MMQGDDSAELTVEEDSGESQPAESSNPYATYNIVSDLYTGVNVRWSDNKLQAIFIAVSIIVLALLA
jgi:hypothetical protein